MAASVGSAATRFRTAQQQRLRALLPERWGLAESLLLAQTQFPEINTLAYQALFDSYAADLKEQIDPAAATNHLGFADGLHRTPFSVFSQPQFHPRFLRTVEHVGIDHGFA